MSTLRGQEVTIVYIDEDGDLYVQLGHGRPRSVNPDSVLKLNGEEPEMEDKLGIVPGDVVELQREQPLGVLNEMDLSVESPDKIQTPGKVLYITDDFEPIVKFHDVLIEIPAKLLKKASAENVQAYQQMKERIEHLKVGDKALIDSGPLDFARGKLNKMKADHEVILALTKPVTVIKIIDPKTVIILNENGIKFKVRKKYLIAPEKFDEVGGNELLDLGAFKEIQDTIIRGITVLEGGKSGENDRCVEIIAIHFAKGRSPSIQLKVNSENVTWSSMLKWLQDNSGWGISVHESRLLINGIPNFNCEVKLGISFGEDEIEIGYQKHVFSKQSSLMDVMAAPNREDHHAGVIEERPDVHSLQDFRYMRLHDLSLGRDVCLPYLVQGPPREPGPVVRENPPVRRPSAVYNLTGARIGNLTTISQLNEMNQENIGPSVFEIH